MRLVFDTEADGLLEQATRVWCIVAQDLDSDYHTSCQYLDNASPDLHHHLVLAKLYEADELIGHNIIGYDLPLLEKLYGWVPRLGTIITDTVIYSRLLRSDRRLPLGCPGNTAPHSLKAWGYRVGRGKVEHDDWTQFSPEMLVRCNEDVAIQVLTYKALVQEERVSPIDWTTALATEHAIAKLIVQQEINGVPFDVATAENLKQELRVGVQEIDDELVPGIPEVALPKSKQATWPRKQFKKDGDATVQAKRYYGEGHNAYRTDIKIKTAPINLGSDKQVKGYLLSIGWVPTEWNFKKDKVTKKPLRDLRGNKVRTSPKLTEESYGSLGSDIGKTITLRLKMAHRLGLVEGLINSVRPDGKITAQAIPQGTPTGRMTHRTVVNIPGHDAYLGPELRGLFGTEPGYVRVGIDLVNCQLRGLCHYMGDIPYQNAVLKGNKEDGTDSHSLTRDLAGLSTRQQGKRFTYAILFGAGDEHLAAILGISVTEAAMARQKFFSNLVKLDQLMKDWARVLKTLGCIRGIDGRALWVRSPHAIMSFMLQDLEAVTMKKFIIILHQRLMYRNGAWPREYMDYKLVTTMHDEVQYLVRPENLAEFKGQAESTIADINKELGFKCPQAIDIQVGKTWADCH